MVLMDGEEIDAEQNNTWQLYRESNTKPELGNITTQKSNFFAKKRNARWETLTKSSVAVLA